MGTAQATQRVEYLLSTLISNPMSAQGVGAVRPAANPTNLSSFLTTHTGNPTNLGGRYLPGPILKPPLLRRTPMAKPRKPTYEFELDDDEDLDDNMAELLYERYMEDISEILGRAYQDIGKKVQNLVEALEKDPE